MSAIAAGCATDDMEAAGDAATPLAIWSNRTDAANGSMKQGDNFFQIEINSQKEAKKNEKNESRVEKKH
jgi:hypothetical protein